MGIWFMRFEFYSQLRRIYKKRLVMKMSLAVSLTSDHELSCSLPEDPTHYFIKEIVNSIHSSFSPGMNPDHPPQLFNLEYVMSLISSTFPTGTYPETCAAHSLLRLNVLNSHRDIPKIRFSVTRDRVLLKGHILESPFL